MSDSKVILNKHFFIRMTAVALAITILVIVFGEVFYFKTEFENNPIVKAVNEQSADYDVKVDIIPEVFQKNISLTEASKILLDNQFFVVNEENESNPIVYMRQFSKPDCPGNYFVYLSINETKQLVAASAEREKILCI